MNINEVIPYPNLKGAGCYGAGNPQLLYILTSQFLIASGSMIGPCIFVTEKFRSFL